MVHASLLWLTDFALHISTVPLNLLPRGTSYQAFLVALSPYKSIQKLHNLQ